MDLTLSYDTDGYGQSAHSPDDAVAAPSPAPSLKRRRTAASTIESCRTCRLRKVGPRLLHHLFILQASTFSFVRDCGPFELGADWPGFRTVAYENPLRSLCLLVRLLLTLSCSLLGKMHWKSG